MGVIHKQFVTTRNGNMYILLKGLHEFTGIINLESELFLILTEKKIKFMIGN